MLQPGEMRSPAVYAKDSLALTAESYHAPVALKTLVADTRDGQPLGKSGPFQLIVSEDSVRPAGCTILLPLRCKAPVNWPA